MKHADTLKAPGIMNTPSTLETSSNLETSSTLESSSTLKSSSTSESSGISESFVTIQCSGSYKDITYAIGYYATTQDLCTFKHTKGGVVEYGHLMRDLITLGRKPGPAVFQSTIGELGADASWKLERGTTDEDEKFALRFVVDDLIAMAKATRELEISNPLEWRMIQLLQHIGKEVAVLGCYSMDRVLDTLLAYQHRQATLWLPVPHVMVALRRERNGSMGACDVDVPVHAGLWVAGTPSIILAEEFRVRSEYGHMFL
jgi:hypothetical protein